MIIVMTIIIFIIATVMTARGAIGVELALVVWLTIVCLCPSIWRQESGGSIRANIINVT